MSQLLNPVEVHHIISVESTGLKSSWFSWSCGIFDWVWRTVECGAFLSVFVADTFCFSLLPFPSACVYCSTLLLVVLCDKKNGLHAKSTVGGSAAEQDADTFIPFSNYPPDVLILQLQSLFLKVIPLHSFRKPINQLIWLLQNHSVQWKTQF